MRNWQRRVLVLVAATLMAGCQPGPPAVQAADAGAQQQGGSAQTGELALATFAGGCFWCMEPPFDKLEGVAATISGYAGGPEQSPSYRQVSSGRTGHLEVIQVSYDPARVSYERLLEVFWHNIDPTDPRGQFCDKGPQYRTAIFWHDEEQRAAAQRSLEKLEASGVLDAPLVTELREFTQFWPAEEYHQDYYEKNPTGYKYYRTGCGRDRRLEQLWGDAAGH